MTELHNHKVAQLNANLKHRRMSAGDAVTLYCALRYTLLHILLLDKHTLPFTPLRLLVIYHSKVAVPRFILRLTRSIASPARTVDLLDILRQRRRMAVGDAVTFQ